MIFVVERPVRFEEVDAAGILFFANLDHMPFIYFQF